MKKIVVCMLLVVGSLQMFGQKPKRLQPGVLYESGDTLYAPRFGFVSVVPDGWEGQLPRDVEVFMLSSRAGQGQIYMFAQDKGTIEEYRKNWAAGVSLSETLKIRSGNAVVVTGDRIESDVVLEGSNANRANKAFAMTRCGAYGPCVTALAVGPSQAYEQFRKATQELFTKAKFIEPSDASPYADLDWREFLSDKMVMSYFVLESASKDTQLHLCGNGQFMADVRKKGLMKSQSPEYKGKLKGTWTVDGTGEQCKLTLKFDKGLPSLETTLTIKEEKVFADDERYFVSYSDYCNK